MSQVTHFYEADFGDPRLPQRPYLLIRGQTLVGKGRNAKPGGPGHPLTSRPPRFSSQKGQELVQRITREQA